jgi:hypothetical protein
MTGQRKSAFSDATRDRLRECLDHGGVLLCDCAVGAIEFRDAFRQEMKSINRELAPKTLPAGHPLFNFRCDTRRVELSPMAGRLLANAVSLQLEVIEVDGLLPVIFSPLSMSAG